MMKFSLLSALNFNKEDCFVCRFFISHPNFRLYLKRFYNRQPCFVFSRNPLQIIHFSTFYSWFISPRNLRKITCPSILNVNYKSSLKFTLAGVTKYKNHD